MAQTKFEMAQEIKFKNVNETPPPTGELILGYNQIWVDKFDNPTGVCQCCYIKTTDTWVYTIWDPVVEEFESVNTVFDVNAPTPTHWTEMPKIVIV
jgi:hypothetical protein